MWNWFGIKEDAWRVTHSFETGLFLQVANTETLGAAAPFAPNAACGVPAHPSNTGLNPISWRFAYH